MGFLLGGEHQPAGPGDVDRVQEMFPHLTRELIAGELARTGSVEATVNDLLEGRVRFAEPPPMPTRRPEPAPGEGDAAGDAHVDGAQRESVVVAPDTRRNLLLAAALRRRAPAHLEDE